MKLYSLFILLLSLVSLLSLSGRLVLTTVNGEEVISNESGQVRRAPDVPASPSLSPSPSPLPSPSAASPSSSLPLGGAALSHVPTLTDVKQEMAEVEHYQQFLMDLKSKVASGALKSEFGSSHPDVPLPTIGDIDKEYSTGVDYMAHLKKLANRIESGEKLNPDEFKLQSASTPASESDSAEDGYEDRTQARIDADDDEEEKFLIMMAAGDDDDDHHHDDTKVAMKMEMDMADMDMIDLVVAVDDDDDADFSLFQRPRPRPRPDRPDRDADVDDNMDEPANPTEEQEDEVPTEEELTNEIQMVQRYLAFLSQVRIRLSKGEKSTDSNPLPTMAELNQEEQDARQYLNRLERLKEQLKAKVAMPSKVKSESKTPIKISIQ